MKKPIIGITSAYEEEKELKHYHRTTVCIDYAESIVKAGGIPFVIPVLKDREVIKKQLELVDGLLMSGGVDINPRYYNQDFLEGTKLVSPERDANEWIILEEFLSMNKPILGICRGMQMINVFKGGTLHQDIKETSKKILKHNQDYLPELKVHKVNIEKNSILSDLFGEQLITNSFHHQSLDKIGQGLKVVATTNDGIIEAIESKEEGFLLGVQWHPEMMTARGSKEMIRIFEKFIEVTTK